jgi:hypothetical protein
MNASECDNAAWKWEGRGLPEQASPRPWRRNPRYGEDAGVHPSPFLDAEGFPVITTSEWMQINDPDIDLIVAAVNAYPTPASEP